MLEDVYLKNSQLPKRYLSEIPLSPAMEDIEAFDKLQEVKDSIVEFVNKGNNLLICSNNVGNGKTTFSTKILKQYIKEVCNRSFVNNCPCLFVNITNFLNEKKLAINDISISNKVKETEQKILTAKLVVFDDLCVKNISEYDMGNLYYWIDERTNNCLSSIYTTNLLPEQLRKVLDERIYSRIVNYSTIVEIKDGDHRECY